MNPDWSKIGALGTIVGIIVSLLQPIIAQWMKVHFPTKESFKFSKEQFLNIYFGLLVAYDFWFLGSLFFSDGPITKWFIFEVCLVFFALTVALIAYLHAKMQRQTRLIFHNYNQIIEMLMKMNSRNITLMKDQDSVLADHTKFISTLKEGADFLVSDKNDQTSPDQPEL